MYTRWKGEISAPKARCDAPNTGTISPDAWGAHEFVPGHQSGVPNTDPFKTQHSKFFSIAL